MSRRRPSPAARARRSAVLWGWVGALGGGLALSGLALAALTAPAPVRLDPVTLCPIDRTPSAHVLLLVDRTDAYDAPQSRLVAETIVALKGGLPVHGRLSAHLLTADPEEAAAAVLDLCNPGDGAAVDPLTGNPRRAQKRFEEGFAAPIEAFVAALMTAQSAPRSPIVEALAVAAALQVRSTPRRIVLVSDLLQNSAAQSHYRARPDAVAMLATPAGRALTDGRLAGAEVALVRLDDPRQAGRQDARLDAFWRDLLIAAGAVPVHPHAPLASEAQP